MPRFETLKNRTSAKNIFNNDNRYYRDHQQDYEESDCDDYEDYNNAGNAKRGGNMKPRYHDDMDDYEDYEGPSRGGKNSSKKYGKSNYKNKDKYMNDREDFISMFYDLMNNVNYKVAILLFFIGIIIFSDTFIEIVLSPINNAVIGDETTTKGTIIQLLLLTLGYIMIDLMVSGDVI